METRNNSQSRAIGGAVMIVIGLMAFAAQIFQNSEIGLWFLPALGVLFLAWGISARNAGLLVPGGILTGLGVGVLLANGGLGKWNESSSGGIIVVCLALGFLSIAPLAAFVGGKSQRWALIPGSILAVIGGALLAGSVGLQALTWASYLLPLALIAGGVYIIFKRQGAQA